MKESEIYKMRKQRFYGFYVGEVMSVKELDDDGEELDEPENRAGRIKVRVHPMMSDIANPEDLPNCYPAIPIGKKGIDIPEEGAIILVSFLAGNFQFPIYMFGFPHLDGDGNPVGIPEVAWQEPEYYGDLNDNRVEEEGDLVEIEEPELEYEDTYPKKKATQRGKMVLEIDETEDGEHILFHILDTNFYFRLTPDRAVIAKFLNAFLHIEEDINITAKNFYMYIQEEKLHIETPDGNQIKIDANGVTLIDGVNTNKVEMTSAGLKLTALDSDAVITMEDGKVKFEDGNTTVIMDGSNFEIEGGGDMTVKNANNELKLGSGGCEINGKLKVNPK